MNKGIALKHLQWFCVLAFSQYINWKVIWYIMCCWLRLVFKFSDVLTNARLKGSDFFQNWCGDPLPYYVHTKYSCIFVVLHIRIHVEFDMSFICTLIKKSTNSSPFGCYSSIRTIFCCPHAETPTLLLQHYNTSPSGGRGHQLCLARWEILPCRIGVTLSRATCKHLHLFWISSCAQSHFCM